MLLFSCKNDVQEQIDDGGYPNEIAAIVKTNCAVSGCHNSASKDAASGLNLETWNDLMDGTRNGSAVIPFKPGFSPVFLFTNVYLDLGPSVTPTMPIGMPPLSKDQVVTIKNWIANGAPNNRGEIKFSDNPTRKKVYITNQGCDLVAVVDATSGLVMRYIDVGVKPGIESPHMVKVSPDGQYWYVIFLDSDVMQKFRTSDDKLVKNIHIGSGFWNTFVITSDGKKAFVCDFSTVGNIAFVDLETENLIANYGGLGFNTPHGMALSSDENFLYVARQFGNHLYKIDVTDPLDPEVSTVVLQPGQNPGPAPGYNPHEIIFTPDGTKYFVSCQGTNEVRVFNASDDTLLDVLQVGEFPQEMAISTTTDYLFVTNMEDKSALVTRPPDGKGSVAIINYKSNTVVAHVYSGYEPHGVAVDNESKLVYISNRNTGTEGPPPHHTTECVGKNGNLTKLDINTLSMIPGYRHELAVDPYSVAVRH
jgi:DNA-binding beta-propeller fold protein YncE